ncbi:MAG: DUF6311 domain-containing protein [Spirochaetaceae bacterium]|nr:DUF6311 domain-containing protein [Spirochaetaceae bacterium]
MKNKAPKGLKLVLLGASMFGLAGCLLLFIEPVFNSATAFFNNPDFIHFVETKIVHKTLNPQNIARHIEDYLNGAVVITFFICVVVLTRILKRRITAAAKAGRIFFGELVKTGAALKIRAAAGTRLFVFLFCGAGGAVFFINVFGTLILDFTYTDWLMGGGDLSQHYLGWRMFRNSAWNFPFGLMDNIVHPFKESVIYTDSIPLFAVLFKLASAVLPVNFQYFGLFGLLIYFLQGAVSAVLVKRLTGDTLYSIIASAFFVLSTTMMQRIYGHTALAAHFILLLCVYVCLPQKPRGLWRETLIWSGLFFLTVGLHLYFTPMVFIFMAFYFFRLYLEKTRTLARLLVSALSALAVMAAAMFLFGAFYSRAGASAGGLGSSSANLNTLFNPAGTSAVLKDLNLATDYQYEGFGYLGAGVLLAAFFAVVYYGLMNTKQIAPFIKNGRARNKTLPAVLCVLAFVLFAVSPEVTFNSKTLFVYYVPSVIHKIWSVFRSTGRFIWPVMYIIMCVAFAALFRAAGRKKAAALLSFLLLFQYYDLNSWFKTKGAYFKAPVIWRTELKSPEWDVFARDCKHIIFLSDYSKIYSFLDLAVKYNLTVNDAYLARKNSGQIEAYKQEELERILNGEARDDAVYIINDDERASLLKGRLSLFLIDGLIAGERRRK